MMQSARGFTCIELLAVLSIFALVLIFSIPSGQHLLAKNRATAQIDMLMHVLQYARNEAIVRNTKLVLCKSADQKKCGGQWRDGQIVLDPAGKVLRVFSALPLQDTLVWNSSGGLDDFITWLPNGYTHAQRGSFYYCTGSKQKETARSIVVLHTGRSYITPLTEAEYVRYCP